MEINKMSSRYLKRYVNVAVPAAYKNGQSGPDFFTPILGIVVPRDNVIRVDPAEKIVLKLFDAGGNQFDPNTDIRVQVIPTGQDALPINLGRGVYGPWYRTAIVDQLDVNKNSGLKLAFPVLGAEPFNLLPGFELRFSVNSITTIDWTPTNPGNSEFSIDLDVYTVAEARALGVRV